MEIPTTPIPKDEYEQFGTSKYISYSLIEKYHTAEGLERFRVWSQHQTLLSLRGKSGVFPSDYERWIEQGMPGDEA